MRPIHPIIERAKAAFPNLEIELGDAQLNRSIISRRIGRYAATHLKMPDTAVELIGQRAAAVGLGNHLKLTWQLTGRMRYEGASSMIVDRELGWRIGLIVSELLTNAVRHGPRAGGAIRIELACAEDQIRCQVLSNGVDMPVRRGRGSEIVSALAHALGGSVSWTFTHRATIASVLFPSGRRQEALSRSAARA